MPPLGYFTRAATGRERDIILDEERAPYLRHMFEMSADGKSGRHIRHWLEENNVRTRGNKQIPLSMIFRILKNPYYYGEFEYPKGSGKWYKGNHEPLISKELFDRVQQALVVPLKPKWGSKEFPYKQFLKCYTCGSSIVGEEKFRQLKNGDKRRHVYYHCSRQVDYTCKELFVYESTIVEELSRLSATLITDSTKFEPGLASAIKNYEKIVSVANPSMGKDEVSSSYIKYVLHEGTLFEKTRLIRNLDVKLALHDRTLIRVE